jgi:creatinine amidohydrolase
MLRTEQVLADKTWTELEAEPPPILLIPLGSTEQHGPHLPLSTDAKIAVALAEGLAERRGDLVVSPCVALGASGEHQGFPGVLSVGTDVLSEVLVELARSARSWTRGLCFVVAHGGNLAAVAQASRVIEAEGDLSCVVTASSPDADAHAGRAETSVLMAIAPRTVRETGQVAGETRALEEIMAELTNGGVRAVSPNGVLGDPSGSSAAEGRARLATMISAGLAVIDERFPA